MIARQQLIDPRHHAVPVKQHVDGHHGYDHEKHDDVDQAGRRGQGGIQQRPAALGDRLTERIERLAHGGAFVQQAGKSFREESAHVARDLGRGVEQGYCLLHEGRDHQQHQQNKDDDRADGDDRRGDRPAASVRLEPVGDRVEEIGDGCAQEKWQQLVAKCIEQHEKDRRRGPPIFQLFAHRQCHAVLREIVMAYKCGVLRAAARGVG